MSSTFDLLAAKLELTREGLIEMFREHIDTALMSHDDVYHPDDDNCVGPTMKTTTRFTSETPTNTIILGLFENPDDWKDRPKKMVKITIEPIDDPVT